MKNYEKYTYVFIILFSIILLSLMSVSATDTVDINDTTGDNIETSYSSQTSDFVGVTDDNDKVTEDKISDTNTNKKNINKNDNNKKSITKQKNNQTTKTLKTSQTNNNSQIQKNITNSDKSLKSATTVSVSNYEQLYNNITNSADETLTVNLGYATYSITTPIVLNSTSKVKKFNNKR